MASLALRQNIIEIIELNSRGQRFVPLISLSKLLPCDEISRILRDLDIVPFYRLEEHSHIIKTHYLKVFSILCLVGGMECLHTSFIQRNIDDSKLPLSTQDIVKLPPEIQKGFSLEQHIFLCPNLRKGLIYQIFDDWTVLPFTEENTLKGGHGAYGTVCKVKIHKDYQKLHVPQLSGTGMVAVSVATHSRTYDVYTNTGRNLISLERKSRRTGMKHRHSNQKDKPLKS